jgi:recombinational DNA repair protein (RecF pathway)
VTTWAVKRCPRCGRVRPADEFYRRRGARLSSYCRSCQRAAAHLARRRRRQDLAAAEQLRAVDRARQRRRRALGGPGPSGGNAA